MIKKIKINPKFILFSIFLFSFSLNVESKNIVDIVEDDPELSIFYSHLKKTGLDEVLRKKPAVEMDNFCPCQ